MSHVALAWMLKEGTDKGRRGVSSPIVGISSIERLADGLAVRGKEKELTDEEAEWLEEPYVPKAIMGHS